MKHAASYSSKLLDKPSGCKIQDSLLPHQWQQSEILHLGRPTFGLAGQLLAWQANQNDSCSQIQWRNHKGALAAW